MSLGSWRATVLLGGAMVAACSGREVPQTLEEQAAEKCPAVHVDRLDGDWILFAGRADPKYRFRVERDGEGYRMAYVGGLFDKLTLVGDKRELDVQFTEVPTAKRKKFVDAGEATLTRLYVQPEFKTCSLKINTGTVTGSGKETVNPRAVEYVAFPKTEETFSYSVPDSPLFIGEAAKSKKAADAEVEKLGEPKGEFTGNPVPVGLWTKTEEDGPASCTYDMDLFFDHIQEKAVGAITAGEAKDGLRHWYHEWDANYGGNHSFEIHRFRTCDGKRELIGVSELEVVLM